MRGALRSLREEVDAKTILSEFLSYMESMKCSLERDEWTVIFDANGPLYGGKLRAYNPQNLTLFLQEATCLRDGRRVPKVVIRGDIVKRIEFMDGLSYKKLLEEAGFSSLKQPRSLASH